MAKTLSDVAYDICTQLGEEYANLDTQETFDSLLKEAITELLAEGDWPFVVSEQDITLVADQAGYSLALGTGEVLSIRDPDEDELLIYEAKNELIENGVDMEETGDPYYWYDDGMTSDQKDIGLWPIPSAIDTLIARYVVDASQLVRTSTLPIPEDCIPALKNAVRKLFKELVEDFNGADRAGQAYTTSVQKLRRRYLGPSAAAYQFEHSDISRSAGVNHIPFPENIL